MSCKFNYKAKFIYVIIALVIVILLGDTTAFIILNFLEQPFMIYPTSYLIVNSYVYLIALMIPITIIHELLHGITYKMFGGKIKFGIKGINPYTQEISGIAIERTEFLIVLLTPLTIISILSLLLPSCVGSIIFILNLLGASGDIFMSLYLLKFNWNSKIIDKDYGFDVI